MPVARLRSRFKLTAPGRGKISSVALGTPQQKAESHVDCTKVLQLSPEEKRQATKEGRS